MLVDHHSLSVGLFVSLPYIFLINCSDYYFSSAAQSSKYSLHSWNGDESESTAELIRLGDSARTFTTKQEGVHDFL